VQNFVARTGGPNVRRTEGPVSRAVASLAAPQTADPPTPPRVGRSHAAAAERGARYVAAHKRESMQSGAGTGMVNQSRPGASARELPVERGRRAARAGRSMASRPAPTGRDEAGALGVPIGIVLVAVLFVEVYFGVARTGLDHGRVLLSFGLALDACGRALGTLAMGRAREHEAAWACALGGSPVVAAVTLFRQSPVEVDPAPLAGLISLLAAFILAVALTAAALGL
jgi:hypothetical protein